MKTFALGASLVLLTGIALAQEHTLTTWSSWDKREDIDIDPPGRSVGDMSVRSGKISLSADGPATGEFYSVNTVVYLDQSGKKTSQLSSEVILPDGSFYTTDFVQFKTAERFEDKNEHSSDGAIIGGTGAYANIRGHYTLELLPSDDDRTIVKTMYHYFLDEAADDPAAAQVESLTSALNSLPMVIFFKDTEGVYRGGNTAWAELVGKPLPELLSGKTDFDLFPEEVAKSFRAYDMAMLASGKTTRNEETLVYPDGRSVLVETTKAPWIGPDGKMRGLIGICVELAAPAAPTTP